MSTFVLGIQGSQFYEFDHNKKGGYTDHTLNDELEILRTREDHSLAVSARGHEQNCGFSPCLLGQKALRGFQKAKIISTKPSANKARRK
jgi:hypothetical protein